MTRFRLAPGATGKVMRSAPVRAALRRRAEVILGRAEGIAASEGYPINAEVVEATRPKGRPTAMVRSADADVEFGSYGKKRRRILGRAADTKE